MTPSQPEIQASPGKVDRTLRSELEHGPFVFLQPGGMVITDAPTRVKTILGSCLTIAVRAPRLGLAVATHCLLPSAGCRVEKLTRSEALKYVDATAGIVFETFAAWGAAWTELEVKLIGGADSLSAGPSAHYFAVGSRNVETALKVLADRGIVPAATIVGGQTGRVLVFDTGNGDVFVKRLPRRLCSFAEAS
jgi:chemotaxis protein CheD